MMLRDALSIALVLAAITVWSALLWALPRMNWPRLPEEPRHKPRPKGHLKIIARNEDEERRLEEERNDDPGAV